jgi:hypothetical protein
MRASIRRSKGVHNPGQGICLGVIVVCEFGRDAEVAEVLAKDPRIELGQAQAGGIPGSVITKLGHDEQLLQELTTTQYVLAIEVVYAQELECDAEESA